MKTAPRIYQLFQTVFSVLAVGITLLVLLWHNNPTFAAKPLPMAALAAVWLLIIAFAARCLPKAKQPPRWAAPLLLAVYTAIILFLCWTLRVGPNGSWDYPIVAQQAQDYVANGTPPGEYFALYPNNAALFWLYTALYRPFYALGVGQIMDVLTVFGCLCIAAGQWFLYKSACLLWGQTRGFWALCFAMTCPALLFYGAIAYTDTVTLPLLAASVYVWLKVRVFIQSGHFNKILLSSMLAFALAAAAAVLKVSAAILAIAFVLDFLVQWPKKHLLRPFLAALILFALLLGIGSRAAKAALPDYGTAPIPYTHWVMMGLNGDGGYNDDDYQQTLQYSTYEARVNFTLRTIGERLHAMGPAGLLRHLARKLSYITSDGLCYVQQKLNHGGVNPKNLFTRFIIPGEPYVGPLYYLADAWQLGLWILCGASAARAVKRRDSRLAFARLALFGLLVFLLLWEARSRYIVNYLPVFILCAVPCDSQ